MIIAYGLAFITGLGLLIWHAIKSLRKGGQDTDPPEDGGGGSGRDDKPGPPSGGGGDDWDGWKEFVAEVEADAVADKVVEPEEVIC